MQLVIRLESDFFRRIQSLEQHGGGGNAPLYLSFRASCLQQFQADLAEGDKALTDGDAPALRRLAHSLKSVLRSLGHPEAASDALTLEEAARGTRRLPAAVVITNHDHGRFVGQAIASALAQTEVEAEVVVVDDGSTDASRGIIESFGDRVRAVFQTHRGQADAMLSGLRSSVAPVVLFLDGDDVLYPHALSAICGRFGPGVAKVQARLDLIDEGGRTLGRQTPPMPMLSGDLAPVVLRHGWYPAPPTTGNAFARHAIERLLPVPARYTALRTADGRMAVSDHYLSVLAALNGRVVSLPSAVGAYRIHGARRDRKSSDLLAEVRRRLERTAVLSEIVSAHPRARASHGRELALGTPNWVKERLVSLVLDPAGHPVPTDTRWRLVRAGVAAAWSVPWSPARMRVVQSVGLLAVAALPRPVVRAVLSAVVLDHVRPRWLSRLSGMEV